MTSDRTRAEFVDILTSFTTVLWLVCAAVSLVGLFEESQGPIPATEPTAPVTMQVDFTAPPQEQSMEAQPAADESPPQPSALPPPTPETPAPTMELAQSAPVVESPVVSRPVAATQVSAVPAIRHLVYGSGEGRQPQPDYPRQAILDNEQGTVGVTFSVDEFGRVISARVSTPSSWPILNSAAVNSIRQTWRFGPGEKRSYEVSITYRLTQ